MNEVTSPSLRPDVFRWDLVSTRKGSDSLVLGLLCILWSWVAFIIVSPFPYSSRERLARIHSSFLYHA